MVSTLTLSMATCDDRSDMSPQIALTWSCSIEKSQRDGGDIGDGLEIRSTKSTARQLRSWLLSADTDIEAQQSILRLLHAVWTPSMV